MSRNKRRLGKKIMPGDKRQKREHPFVEHWLSLSNIAKAVAQETKQQHQYTALLMQVSEVTQHDSSVPDNKWSGEQVDFEDVRNYVLSWIDDYDENLRHMTLSCESALATLKNADSQDDDALKAAAVQLTEAEMNLKKLDTFNSRWQRIVRYKPSLKTSLRDHTDKWLTRWLRQWETTNRQKSHHVLQFHDALAAVSRDSVTPVLVQNRTQEPPSRLQRTSNTPEQCT